MIRHSVTVSPTRIGSYRAICSTCGWQGYHFVERDRADADGLRHSEALEPVVPDAAMQATTDAAGATAERRHLALRSTSAAAAHAAARSQARGRVEAALGNSAHQDILDAEIDRHLAPRRPRVQRPRVPYDSPRLGLHRDEPGVTAERAGARDQALVAVVLHDGLRLHLPVRRQPPTLDR
jgi:hypothetical protein